MIVSAALAVAVVLAAVASVLWYHARTGVPPVPSTAKEIADVAALLLDARLPEAPTIYELGCGAGSMALGLADLLPRARIVGVEISPLPYWIARLRARGHPRVSIRRADFTDLPLDEADAVTAYLMIGAAARLAPVLDRRLRPGAVVVTSLFWFRDRHPEATRAQAARYRWPGPVKLER